ncbi:MAG: glycosidase [Thermoprotei archaeon]|nr:MAG: glycosidase [Thermoprotei archaeon]
MFILRGFKNSINMKKASEVREFRTIDIVKRLGVISPNRVHLKNYPIDNPISIFNSAIVIKNDYAKVYARIILGYFMYLSGIVLLEIPLDDLFTGIISVSHYPGELVLYPSTKHDIWGTEDPRVSRINDMNVMVYTGRTINYFNPAIRRYRTIPIAAIDYGNDKWHKVAVFIFPQGVREHIISDKDAFLVKTSDGTLLLFHRPHMDDENFYLVISKVSEDIITRKTVEEIKVVEVRDTTLALEPAKFEIKLGWAAPPIEIEKDTYLTLIHGVDKEIEGYRIFAAIFKYDKDRGIDVVAVTPYYIMEPKMPYELFGDRPFTVFPCGACLVDNKIIISYGAADYVIGFGEIDLNELLSHLEKGKLE